MITDQTSKYPLFPFATNNLQEYLFAFRPDETTSRILKQERQVLQESCGGPLLQSAVQLPVIQFLGNEQMEERIIRWVQRICAGERSFLLSGSIANDLVNQAVMVRIDDTDALRQFIAKLHVINDIIVAEHCPPVRDIKNLALLLAEQLPSTVIQQIRNYYAGKHMPRLIINELTLYKRQHAFDPWKTVNVFRLPALQEIGTP